MVVVFRAFQYDLIYIKLSMSYLPYLHVWHYSALIKDVFNIWSNNQLFIKT